MTTIGSTTASGPTASLGSDDARLLEQAKKLEGVFLAQLYQAMRATVPEGGMDASTGQELFTGMLDDAVADLNSSQSESKFSRALYEQLRRRTPPPRSE